MKNINENIEKIRGNVLLLTHTDLDGYGPETVVKALQNNPWFLNRFDSWDTRHLRNDQMDSVIRTVCLDKETWDKYDAVIITDLSCGEATAEMIEKSGYADRIILLDHHKTALGLNKFSFAYVEEFEPDRAFGVLFSGYKVLDGKSRKMSCGTSLFVRFLRAAIPKLKDHWSICRIFWFAENVRAWDTWDWKNLHGGIIEPKRLNDLFLAFGQNSLFAEKVGENISHGHEYDYGYEVLLQILDMKKADHIALLESNKDQIMRYSLTFEGRKYRMLLVWSDGYISDAVQWLEEQDPEGVYDIYAIDSGQGISLRSLKDDVDVSLIAKCYGGGGHKHASGIPLLNRMAYIEARFAEYGKIEKEK